jgi:hypothetical protein
MSCSLVRSLLLILSASVMLAAPALGQPEKILDTPTGWTYLYGATSSTINAEVNAGRRPFTIKRVGANSYDVVTVTNTGNYAMPGFGTGNMHYNRTLSQLSNELTNRRLVSLDCYEVSGTTYMSAISIPNSGAQGAGWGWLVGQTRQQIVDWVANSSTPLRILDLSIYTAGGQKRYSAVAVVNQGAQQQSWWWYFDKTGTEVIQLLQQHNARLIDIELETAPTPWSPARFAVVMVAQNPGANWVYTSLTQAQVTEMVGQTGGRLTNLHRYTNAAGNTRFAASLVDNANAQSRRLRDYMAAQATTGTYGFMAKRVNGPVVASLNEHFEFEPASTMKIVHAAYAIRQCSSGQSNLDGLIMVPNRCNTDYWTNICPEIDYSCNSGTEALRLTIRSMLRNSHNGRTRTIEEIYGRAVLNNFMANTAGLGSIRINHTLGCLCGNPFNTMTADQAARFYEQIGNGTHFNASWRDQLFDLMLSVETDGYGSSPGFLFYTLGQVIAQEAAQTNLTAAGVTAFRNAMRFATKGGAYSCGDERWRSAAAWASVPYKVFASGNWVISPRAYGLAAYVHGGTDPGANVAYATLEELLREQIREALETWEAACTLGVAVHPQNTTVDEGQLAQLTCAAGGFGDPTYRWQIQTASGSWLNLGEFPGVLTGVNTNTLTFHAARLVDAGTYRCRITKYCGIVETNPATLTVIPEGVTSAPQALPTHLLLHAPTPNPFNPQVTLRFELPRQTDLALLEIFDVAGRRVRVLSAASLPPGAHEFNWNGTDDGGRRVSSGMYLARLRAGGEQATRRLMMVE